MEKLLEKGSIFSFASSPEGAVRAATIAILVLAIILVCLLFRIRPVEIIAKFINWLLKKFGEIINKAETGYHRDLTIGKINEKKSKVKVYRFLNELTIDLGLKTKGVTPYEFLFIVMVLTLAATVMLTEILFSNLWMALILYPIFTCGVICVLYTKANLAHDRRIEAIIEAENIICNSISGGVLVAVKNSINTIPLEVRQEFLNFIDNIESKNYHIRTALMELNNELGSVSDDFIKKCIVFELEEEHGIVGIFTDVISINNIRTEMRIEMKRRFEEVTNQFLIGAGMIFVFLFGVMAIFEDVRAFYFNSILGQIILCIDALILIAEFVYITYLRAQEL